MFKRSIGLALLGCALSNIGFASITKTFVPTEPVMKKSNISRLNNAQHSTINPYFIGDWSGACKINDYKVNLKISITSNSLNMEASDDNDNGTDSEDYILDSVNSTSNTTNGFFNQKISKFRIGANDTLVIEETTASGFIQNNGSENSQYTSIGALTFSLKNEQLVLNTHVKLFIGLEEMNSYNFTCAINKSQLARKLANFAEPTRS
jgi:hypothetical protein